MDTKLDISETAKYALSLSGSLDDLKRLAATGASLVRAEVYLPGAEKELLGIARQEDKEAESELAALQGAAIKAGLRLGKVSHADCGNGPPIYIKVYGTPQKIADLAAMLEAGSVRNVSQAERDIPRAGGSTREGRLG